ncbi:hypothetical protein QM012_000066 [Aureobasidium pullulans]|uniref:WD40 repeat-like protein n=1 Tax=Aureobasidium pullulans TaxID=5580 RepID=A0ABR0TUN1_AURPU
MAQDVVTPPDTQQKLRCVASTGDTFRCTVDEAHPGWADQTRGLATRADKNESNCFRHALLSADGTAVVTYNEDLILRTFAVPLAHSDDEPADIKPYCSAPSPAKLTSLTLHPAFDVTNPATTLLAISQPDLPIRLTNALDLTYTHASYTWQNSLTEAYIAPSSLLFVDDNHFVAGAKDSLAVFDIHNQDAPVVEYPMRKGRKARKLYGADNAGIGGIVSSLALSIDNLLAAGTYNRQVGLYDNAGQGESIAAFDLSYDDADDKLLKGNGVSQLAWSPCGNYLFVAERQSDALLVYDIRHTGRRLNYLSGRHALTTLKLSFDFATDTNGKIDMWAGGTDGKVRVWRDVTSREGRIEPDLALHASQAAVSNTILNHREPMLITTSGQRRSPSDLVGLDDSDPDLSSSESSSDSEESESDFDEHEKSGLHGQDAQYETPASGMSSIVAVEDPWRGPAFDNVLSFWRIV